jgi:ribosomal protein L7/L12
MESIIPEKSAKTLSLVEASELIRQIEEAFGVVAAAPTSDSSFVIKEIDNIFVELTRLDAHISESQAGIDDLKMETREMLAELSKSIV